MRKSTTIIPIKGARKTENEERTVMNVAARLMSCQG